MQTHEPLSAAASAGVGLSLASLSSTDWRLALVNGAITLGAAALAAWMKRSRGGKPARRKRTAITPGATTQSKP